MTVVRSIPFYLTAAILVMLCCAQPTQHAGGVTDTGNSYAMAVRGRVLDTAGAPVVGAFVAARPADYNEPLVRSSAAGVRTGLTDSEGIYVIDSLVAGGYRIHITARQLTAQHDLLVAEGDSVVEVGEQRLETPGSVAGTVRAVDSVGNLIESDTVLQPMMLRVVLLGLDIADTLAPGDSGTFLLEGVPAGNHRLLVSSPSGHYRSARITIPSLGAGERRTTDTVRVFSYGQETLTDWAYSKRGFVHAGPQDAALTANLEGFPLLVRLNRTNYDFSQTRPDGADIRFANSQGQPLPHHIIHYDSAAHEAAVWVRLDKVYADSTTVFRMYWGNPDAPDFSISADVFTGPAKYAGVYPMERNSAGQVIDAGEKGHHATPSLSRPPAPGYIGHAQWFDGVDDHIAIDAATFPGLHSSFMIAAWVKLDDVRESHKHIIVSQKSSLDDTTGYVFSGNPGAASGAASVSLAGTGNAVVTGSTEWTDSWHMIAVSVHLGKADVYFDGQRITTSDTLSAAAGSGPVTIGGIAGSGGFSGMIDELVIAGRSRSSEWIRMQWENQRRNSRLVSFEQ